MEDLNLIAILQEHEPLDVAATKDPTQQELFASAVATFDIS